MSGNSGPTESPGCPLLPSIRARQTPGPSRSRRSGGVWLLERDTGQCTVHHEGPAEAPKNQLRRRFDPRRLPLELTQAIGHVRDEKCRSLLREWCDGEPAIDGPLRALRTDGDRVSYARLGSENPATLGAFLPKIGTLVFTDGGMSYARPGEYQLLDLDSRRAFGSVPLRQ